MAKTAAKTPKKAVAKKVATLSFDSNVLVKKLLGEVPERAREVLSFRFGLGTTSDRQTLEAIGERWGITRERVRQIEASGIETVRNSAAFAASASAFSELASHIESLGSVVPEDVLLSGLASDEKSRNRFRFLLVVGSEFFRERETDEFYARWHVDQKTASVVHAALTRLYGTLDDAEVLSEGDIINRFLEELDHLWQETGGEGSVHGASWPTFAKEEVTEVTIGVQVNGKKRGEILLSSTESEESAVEKARAVPAVETALGGKPPARTVYVPGRILNLIPADGSGGM